MIYKNFIKFPLDFLLALFLFLLLFPILLILFFFVFLDFKSNPIFKQKRIGFQNQVFTIYKFKTMQAQKADSGALLSDFERLSPFGKFLRKTSLDELPQLVNVLKGEMSFVGPRPLLVEYLEHYDSTQIKRHDVKPGITGWAQVNGRNAISWKEKFQLDVFYIRNISFWFDLKILFKTFFQIFKGKNINQNEQGFMEKFSSKD